jgi:hypothetical protein
MKATLRFEDPLLERPAVRNWHDLLLGIVATLVIEVDDRVLYREEMFPIVELRSELAKWVDAGGLRVGRDFELESMETEEKGVVWLRRVESGWRIGSLYQEFPAMESLSDSSVASLTDSFIHDVDAWVYDNVGVRVQDMLPQ